MTLAKRFQRLFLRAFIVSREKKEKKMVIEMRATFCGRRRDDGRLVICSLGAALVCDDSSGAFVSSRMGLVSVFH